MRLGVLLQQLDAPDDLIQRACPQLREVLTHLLGDQEQVVDDVLRPALELRPQVLALRGDSGWASVEVTLPCHIAAERHEHTRAEPELFRAQESGDHDVAPVSQTAVGAKADAVAQPV